MRSGLIRKILFLVVYLIIILLFPCIYSNEIRADEGDFSISIDKAYLKVGEPLTFTVQNATGSGIEIKYLIDERKVDGENLILNSEDYEKWITVQAYYDNNFIGEDKAYFSKLPVVYISTEDGQGITSKEVYKSGNLCIQNNDETVDYEYNGAVEIKGRGNTSWGFPKKSYRIKLEKKTALFEMESNKNWVLIANYLDECFLRNDTAFKLAKQLGLVTMDCVWVDVVLNGEFVGNYLLCEQIRIDEGRIDIFDWESLGKKIASAICKKEKIKGTSKDEFEDYMQENLAWVTSGYVEFKGKQYNISEYYDSNDNIGGGIYLNYLMNMMKYQSLLQIPD